MIVDENCLSDIGISFPYESTTAVSSLNNNIDSIATEKRLGSQIILDEEVLQ